MSDHIHKAMVEILNSGEIENASFLEHLAGRLAQILDAINEEQQALVSRHEMERRRLQEIIAGKQRQIVELRGRNQGQRGSNVSETDKIKACKIILKRNKSNEFFNLNECSAKQEYTEKSQNILGANRLSLQVGMSLEQCQAQEIKKRTCRISSANIKNKLINKPKSATIQNLLPSGLTRTSKKLVMPKHEEYLQQIDENVPQRQQTYLSPRCSTQRTSKQTHQEPKASQKKQNESEAKMKRRKPSFCQNSQECNKVKMCTARPKKPLPKHIELIPVKTLSVSGPKPR